MKSIISVLKFVLTITLVGVVLGHLRQNHRWLYFPLSWAFSLMAGSLLTWAILVTFDQSVAGSFYSQFKSWWWIFLPNVILLNWPFGLAVIGVQKWLFKEAAREQTTWWERIYGPIIAVSFFALIYLHESVLWIAMFVVTALFVYDLDKKDPVV